VWQHGNGSWHFVSLPTAVADEVEDLAGPPTEGFGAVRVEVTVGGSCWLTSVFPDSKRRTYVLPLKKAVRRAEGLSAGSIALIELRVVRQPGRLMP
jgi:hypothetical protein